MSIQDLTSLEVAIRTWMLAITSVDVIHADENIPAPNSSSGDDVNPVNPWFTYKITNIQGIGIDFVPQPIGNIGAPTLVEIDGNRSFTLQILGFGKGCYQLTSNLKDSLSRPSQLDTLRLADVVVLDKNNTIIDLSTLDGTEMEERSSFDIFMSTDSVITNEDIGRVESVENAIGTYKNPIPPDRTITLNITTG